MKKVFLVANWKLNKTKVEAEKWTGTLSSSSINFAEFKKVIICPSSPLLGVVKSEIQKSIGQKLDIQVGAQDVSQFSEGAYTGEVSAKQIKDLAEFVIVGHSERRRNFSENIDIVNQKIRNALEYNLIPIVCVSRLDEVKVLDSKLALLKIIVAYEPIFAIGTGTPDTPENADEMAGKIKDLLGEIPVLYGGSVSKFNVKNFTAMPHIDGALVGRASLDPHEFISIIQNA